MDNMKRKGNSIIGVIGTGRFGLAVAEEIIARGKHVIAIDKDPARLRPLSRLDADIFVSADMSKESLEETGIQEADAVVIGIGKDIESSILATLNIQEFGITKIIAKVVSPDHAKILQKLGVEVIFPEVEIGKRIGLRLCETLAEDVLPLSDEFSILQMRTPDALDGKTVQGIELRKHWGVSLIATIRDGKANGSIGPDTILSSDEIMVLSGSNRLLGKFQQAFS